MYFTMDMGTSNTRLWLCEGERVLDVRRAPFGAKLGKTDGKQVLYAAVKDMIRELLDAHALSEQDIETVVASGMAGSEMGLCEIPHVCLPADEYALAAKLAERQLTDITSIPFLFVPGLKQMQGEALADIMRGEETETVGLLDNLPVDKEVTLLLPGTHNKIIHLSRTGQIVDFRTTMSGELLDLAVTQSILAGSVSHSAPLSPLDVKRGAAYAHSNGITAALFHARVMQKNGQMSEALSSFVYGAVLGQDVSLVRKIAKNTPIYIGGNERLQAVYGLLLEEDGATCLSKEISADSVCHGLQRIYRIHKAHAARATTLDSIARQKLIGIVRAPDLDTLIQAADALYGGGVRLLEITFDRTSVGPTENTCRAISMLCDHFGDKMLIGAGTVTRPEEVVAARNAGAAYIISPNCDERIIKLTKKLGLVSIPAAFTPTEIAAAVDAGADYVKLFPADQLTPDYVKAVTAPLSDAKLLAVGGVTPENAGELMRQGFCGVGVGSGLYNKKLIHAGDYTALTAIARTLVDSVNA